MKLVILIICVFCFNTTSAEVDICKVSSMKYFEIEDFVCKETGENKMNSRFLYRLDELRCRCGFPFIVNSGFRSKHHSEEIPPKKLTGPGYHTKGIAADIRVRGSANRRKILEEAFKMGFGGIGIYKGFIHLDDRTIELGSTPVVWVGQ